MFLYDELKGLPGWLSSLWLGRCGKLTLFLIFF